MYFHQALQQPDAGEFVKAVIKEIDDHIEHKRWKLIKCCEVPKDVDVIPSVWAMRHKRNVTTNEITKYKSRLYLHGELLQYLCPGRDMVRDKINYHYCHPLHVITSSN